MKILLGITGSVAAKLTHKIAAALINENHEVQIVATQSSFYFWSENDLTPETREKIKILRDADEWIGDRYVEDEPVAHIELSKWADVFLIAPATKNTLGKLAYGIADNLLTCVGAAWWNHEAGDQKPLIVAPAMNTRMWHHPTTEMHFHMLRRFYKEKLIIIPPVSRKLACGDTGIGALADIKDIAAAVR